MNPTVRWEVVPEHAEPGEPADRFGSLAELLGPDGLRLDAWLRGGLAQVIKHGPHRTVYRVQLAGLDCFVKHYRLHDTRAWLRELVRPSKARMEYERALAVAACGLPTVQPLALGEQVGPGPGDSFLVTRTLQETVTLGTFLERDFPGLAGPRQTILRQRLALRLGEFMARLHDAGITHHDLHSGNILLRLAEGDWPEFFLIDLHAVTLGRPLDWQASRENLVMLNRWFVLRASRADRLRFWQVYCQTRRPGDKETRRQGEDSFSSVSLSPGLLVSRSRFLEAETRRSNFAFWSSRDQRCLVNNRYYRRLAAPGIVGHAVTDLDRAALDALLADPDRPFRDAQRLLKDSRSSTVAEYQLPIQGQMRRVVCKRFRVTSWSDPWLALVRQPAWLRSWIWGHGLRERCLPTPRPLAVFHRVKGGLPREGYLVVEKVEDAMDLHHFVRDLEQRPEAERRQIVREWVDRLARLVRELHRRGLSHRDLKAANVLITAESAWLIDLVGVTRLRHRPWRRRVQNLARLAASFLHTGVLTRTDRLRFLRVYLEWGFFGRDRWKRWWRAVEEATQTKAEQNQRRGRILV